jgi:hypothetical protein
VKLAVKGWFMRIEVIKCDRCGVEGALTYKFVTGRGIDLSGNEFEFDHEEIDLCLRCAGSFLDAEKCIDIKKKGDLSVYSALDRKA